MQSFSGYIHFDLAIVPGEVPQRSVSSSAVLPLDGMPILPEPSRLESPTSGNLRLQRVNGKLGGGFKYVLFSPLPGEDSHFD